MDGQIFTILKDERARASALLLCYFPALFLLHFKLQSEASSPLIHTADMLPPPPKMSDGGDAPLRMADDSDDTEHEEVAFDDSLPAPAAPNSTTSVRKAKPIRTARPKKGKKFMTNPSAMHTLIDLVNRSLETRIREKRDLEGEALKRAAQRAESVRKRKEGKREKLEKMKDRLRQKTKGGRGKDSARAQEKGHSQRDDTKHAGTTGNRAKGTKKRVTFKE